MKKYLLLLLVCLSTSAVMANRYKFEIPRPSENVSTATCLYGPAQPHIESVGSTIVFSVNTKMLRIEVGEQSTNVFYELPVDKWYNYKTKTYTTSWWYTNDGQGGVESMLL